MANRCKIFLNVYIHQLIIDLLLSKLLLVIRSPIGDFRNLPNLDFLLIELIIKCKLNETQGQDWGVPLTKKLKLILIGKFKSVKFRNVKFD
jgi:hypothetical protein